MKKTVRISALVLALVLFASCICFADAPLMTTAQPSDTVLLTTAAESNITGIVPGDGETGKQITNMAVKIKFDTAVSDSANDEANKKLISIKAEDGTVVDFTVAHHSKYQNEIWCIVDGDLVSNTTYYVTVQNGIISDDGQVLSSSMSSTFKTRNMKTDSTVNVVLMFGMMAVMFITTSQATKKKNEGKDAKPVTQSAVQANPYKLAKEQGISVDEAKAQIAKEKEKEAKKNAGKVKAYEKKLAEEKAMEEEISKRAQEIYEKSIYHVHKRGSLVDHGYKIPKPVQKKLDKYSK